MTKVIPNMFLMKDSQYIWQFHVPIINECMCTTSTAWLPLKIYDIVGIETNVT